MFKNCNELFIAINSCPKEAKKILEAAHSCFKRKLVIVMDNKEEFVITGFSANRKSMRLVR